MTEKTEDLIARLKESAGVFEGSPAGDLFAEAANRLAALTEEHERTKRGAKTLGEMIKRQCDDIVKITDSQHLIDETGDGDWGLVWERGFDMRERLAALTAPQEGDVRERLAEVLWGSWDERDWEWVDNSELEKSRWRSVATQILAAFPVLSRDIAGEISLCVECEETEVLGKPEHRVVCMDCAYETGRAAAPAETEWEYSVGFDDPEYGWTNDIADIHDEQEDAEEDFRNSFGSWLDGDQIVRRRKAGPWEPVGGENDGA